MPQTRHRGDGFGHSLTDLMTSVAVIFILLFLVFLRNEQQEIAIRKRQTETNLEKLFARLAGEFSGDDIHVTKDENDPLTLLIVLRDNPDLLSFKVNESFVSPRAYSFLQDFIPRVSEVVCTRDSQGLIDSIIIEGHTDSDGSDDDNTKLSARRATEVLIRSRQILRSKDEASARDTQSLESCFLHFAQATGRGEQDLIRADTGREDKKASRRVVVKVRVKSLEQREQIAGVSEGGVDG